MPRSVPCCYEQVCTSVDWRSNNEHLHSAVEEELQRRSPRCPVQHFDARQGLEEQHDEWCLVHEVRQHTVYLGHGVHLRPQCSGEQCAPSPTRCQN